MTDKEGYFEFHFNPRTSPETFQPWYDVELELLDVPGMDEKPARAKGHILVPPLDCDFGVISDVDDTVIQTSATSLLKMAQTTFLHSAHTRLPFEGVAAFYQALQKGPNGDSHNPIFYVSSSPWNLYDLLEDFFELNGVPMGPFLLRDLGLERDRFIKSGHHEHKLAQIERVLMTYPGLLFILIGDSGQKDPEIYEQVVRDFPGRILTIYIRDVTPDARDEEVRALARAAHDLGVEIRLVPDSGVAATHAAEEGFINAKALPSIMAEKAKDEGAPSGLA